MGDQKERSTGQNEDSSKVLRKGQKNSAGGYGDMQHPLYPPIQRILCPMRCPSFLD